MSKNLVVKEVSLPSIKEAVNFTLAVYQFDATPYREYAESYVKKYAGLEFTEEDVKDVNRIIAQLNKQAKDIDTVRKDIKREFNKPLVSFEADINSVSAVYENTVQILKTKVEVFEKKHIEEKVITINELIEQAVKAVGLNEKHAEQIVILDKYLNKTETISKIKKDLGERCKLQFTYQENERLAKEAEAERVARRIKMLDELNKNYKGRIASDISYPSTISLTDRELQELFEECAANYLNILTTKIPSTVEASNTLLAPTVHHRYICEITTTSEEDTILPWLKKMKDHGITTYVHKKMEE